ncbi:MAG: HAMP domain-containing histidine kinase [Actinobacteria bacterium]|nr:HAMP domain-containing histidine kinase [Actinomycetota bacterium]
MIGFALLVACGTLTVGLVLALGLRRLPTVRLQLAGLALVAVLLPLSAVVLSGLVMFQSGHDLTILAVAAGSACAAIAAALAVGGSVSASLTRLAGVTRQLERGDLTARAPVEGAAELRTLAGSFNEMAGSLERLFDARRELVAWASHDLRTPLANMQAMLEAVEDGLAEPAEYVPALREQVTALSRLTDDLFELARIDSGALTLELRDVELSGLVRSCLRGVEAEARSRQVTLEARTEDSVSARCAPEKVERVLLNLLANALRHTPSDGSVAIVVEAEPDGVRVTVEDTGDGLSPESLRRMFERFWRGDPARSARGAGLGLAIARGLVEAHGGRIWAENRPGGGASVSFTLPA